MTVRLEMGDDPQPGEQVRVTMLRPDGTVDDTRRPVWDRELRVSASLRYDRRSPMHLGTILDLPATYYPADTLRDVEVRLRGGGDVVWAALLTHTHAEEVLETPGWSRDMPATSPFRLEVWLPDPAWGGWQLHRLPRVELDTMTTRERIAEDAWDRAWERRTASTLFLEPPPEPQPGDRFALWVWQCRENRADAGPFAGSPWTWQRVDALPDDAPAEVDA